MSDFSTIRINLETKEVLDSFKLPSESYSNLIVRLLEENKKLKSDVEYLKEDKAKLYELVLGTSNSAALINNIHKATYFITKVVNDVSLTDEEKLQQLKTYLEEMLEDNPSDVMATIGNLKQMLKLDQVEVPEVLIEFEKYVINQLD